MTTRWRTLGLVIVGAGLAGCPIGDDLYPKPDDLTPEWLLDRVRLLGIRADPPEIGLGQRATFEALLIDPNAEVGVRLWSACPPEDEGGEGFGCISDLPDFSSVDDPSAVDPDALEAAGIIAVQILPGVPQPSYGPTCADIRWPDACQSQPTTCDDPSLDLTQCCEQVDPTTGQARGLAACASVDKLYSLIQVAAIPRSALEGLTDPAPPADAAAPEDRFDFNDVEVGFKRLVLSGTPRPNANPVIDGYRVDGFGLGPDDVLEVDPGETYTIEALVPPESAELYTYVPSSCREATDPPPPDACADPSLQDPADACAPQCRTEEPYLKWYATAGTIREAVTLFGFFDTTWTAPSLDDPVLATSGDIWAVARDRRGGMGWRRLPWRLRGVP